MRVSAPYSYSFPSNPLPPTHPWDFSEPYPQSQGTQYQEMLPLDNFDYSLIDPALEEELDQMTTFAEDPFLGSDINTYPVMGENLPLSIPSQPSGSSFQTGIEDPFGFNIFTGGPSDLRPVQPLQVQYPQRPSFYVPVLPTWSPSSSTASDLALNDFDAILPAPAPDTPDIASLPTGTCRVGGCNVEVPLDEDMLRRHMSTHTKTARKEGRLPEHIVECAWDDCGAHMRVDSLRKHYIKHFGRVGGKCNRCGSSFSRNDARTRHRIRKYEDKPSPCEFNLMMAARARKRLAKRGAAQRTRRQLVTQPYPIAPAVVNERRMSLRSATRNRN
ncbi:hypothetical protein NLI96_g9769 [Meripilus lineatus]|uniref:C2H2-type domain-containing protein n=1 Tax=Meripilus lineatus TaxID=2056292 RepID=A0AAD5UV58_9APHY|nr:hypothetical protein NLI96_g9769 [Physisporinus lineatus]